MVETTQTWSLAQVLTVLFSGVNLVVVFSAIWWLATTFATIKVKLESLMSLPSRVAVLERDLAVLQKDLNNLWQAFRDDCTEQHGIPEAFVQFLEELDSRREHAERSVREMKG